jgi:hypothetical protein
MTIGRPVAATDVCPSVQRGSIHVEIDPLNAENQSTK